jgi:alginate O-acetyltransferase complex protein AlgJ
MATATIPGMSSPAHWSSDCQQDLIPEHVKAVFREFLGRAPASSEIDAWMQTRSLRAFLEGVLVSDEYAQRLATRESGEGADGPRLATRELGKQEDGPFLNCWIAGHSERFTRPPGEISPDGLAIVGSSGHLFIYGGTNDNVTAQRGEVQLPNGWIDEWQTLIDERIAAAGGAGRQIVYLVVPDKIVVYADRFPLDLATNNLRPVLRLLDEARLPLLYPLDVLQRARADGDTYLCTDSHLTLLGNQQLAVAMMTALGVSADVDAESGSQEFVYDGDIGRHFNPPVVEIRPVAATPSRARIVFDNSADVARVGAHVGTMRVFRNDHAEDQRTVVVFGDSYSYGDDGYRGLSWFLAQTFREVHFVWVPFGWDPDYLDSVDADVAVCQIAERFVARVPQARVDVRTMVRETINTGVALTVENSFRDQQT